MKTFDPGVDYRNQFVGFCIAYLDNDQLTPQEHLFSENDFTFHNTLHYTSSKIITLYAGSTEVAIKEAQELGHKRILWAKRGLTYLNRIVQNIMNYSYIDCANWQHDLVGWINLDTSEWQEIPDKVVSALKDTYQYKDYNIGMNYYNLISNYKRWFVTNTEVKKLEVYKKHQTEIQITAGALTPAIEAYKYFHEPSKIIIVDNSIVAHHMYDYLVENWNGRDYVDFIHSICKRYPSIVQDFSAFDDEKLLPYSDFVNTPEFAEKWEITKRSTVLHIYKDILAWDASYLITGCNSYNTFVDYSNAYNFYPTAIICTQEHRHKQFMKVYKKIADKNAEHKDFNIIFKDRGHNGILRYRGRRP